MDLIELLIELLSRALSGPKTRPPPTAPASNDLVRQIQDRIEAARQQAAQGNRSSGQGPMMARLPPPKRVPMRAPARAQVRPMPAKRVQIPPQKKRKGKRVEPPPLFGQAVIQPASLSVPAAPAVVTPAKPAAPSTDARMLARWLRPQTLRAQFILTEVFQPPVALRDSHLT